MPPIKAESCTYQEDSASKLINFYNATPVGTKFDDKSTDNVSTFSDIPIPSQKGNVLINFSPCLGGVRD